MMASQPQPNCGGSWPSTSTCSGASGSAATVRRIAFFFHAEDGIRAYKVTGVQTCALPISQPVVSLAMLTGEARGQHAACAQGRFEIGRAACRERGESSVVAVSLKKKK